MRLLEHQSKTLLSTFGLSFSPSDLTFGVEEACRAASRRAGPVVFKAQVPFGGRQKAGAIAFVRNDQEAKAAAGRLFGMELRGVRVGTVAVEPQIAFTRELYAGITWDLSARRPVALLSTCGGVDVEGAAPAVKRLLDPVRGLPAFRGREMARSAGLKGKTLVAAAETLRTMAAAFLALDALTLEINPLVETAEGALVGLDAHVEIDDDAAIRQVDRLKTLGEVAPSGRGRPPTALEREAQRIDASDHRGVSGRVVEFDGDLALLIGGGGASLTVFDAIRRHGGRPANYCEVGGNPMEEKVAALTRLLLSKPGVRKLAVIMNVVNNTRADVMARGVLAGIKGAGRDPAQTVCVFRIPGAFEQEASAILAAAGVETLGRETSLDEAARLAVERAFSHVA